MWKESLFLFCEFKISLVQLWFLAVKKPGFSAVAGVVVIPVGFENQTQLCQLSTLPSSVFKIYVST